MVRKFTLLALGLLFGSSLTAQNLIPNPGFENLVTPPCSWITSPAGFAGAVQNWTLPSNGSSDIFTNMVSTTCFGHNLSTHASRIGQQVPHAGNAQSAILTYGAGCGFQPNYREYIQTQLTTPMVAGQDYDVVFFISLGDQSQFATNNFGAYFSTSSVFQATCFVLPYTPQWNHSVVINDKVNWVQVSGTVTATANWQYVVIGNFFSNAATATVNTGGPSGNTRYYIDDVVVRPAIILPAEQLDFRGQYTPQGEVELAWAMSEPDEAVSYTLQRSLDGMSWYDIHSEDAGATKMEYQYVDRFPVEGKSYYRLRYLDRNGERHQSEVVTVDDAGIYQPELILAGNPSSHGEPAWVRIIHADDSEGQVVLLDLQGRELHRSELTRLRDLDGYAIPTEGLSAGIYLVQLRAAGQVHTAKLQVRP